jgi:hypothetical protein
MQLGNGPHQERGAVLIVALLAMLAMAALGFGVIFVTSTESRIAANTQLSTAGFYAAEAGLNRGAESARQIFQAFQTPEGQACLALMPAAAGGAGANLCDGPSNDYAPVTFDLPNASRRTTYWLTYLEPDPDRVAQGIPANRAGPRPRQVQIPRGQPFSGLSATELTYTVRSVAHNLTGERQAQALLESQFVIRLIPLFQFAAFYEQDLEIFPGPPMTLTGPVHTNANLYLGSGAGLAVHGQVTAASDIYRGRKQGIGGGCTSWVRIADEGGTLRDLDPNPPGCQETLVPPENFAVYGSRVQPNFGQVGIPDPGSFERQPDAQYWQRADFRLVMVEGQYDVIDTVTVAGVSVDIVAPRIEVWSNITPDDPPFVDATLTARLRQMMRDDPRIVTANLPPTGNRLQPSSYPGGTIPAMCSPFEDPSTGRLAALSAAQSPAPYDSWTQAQRQQVCDRAVARGDFFNHRESDSLFMLNLDMNRLLAYNHSLPGGNRFFDPDDATDGGLVLYASVTDPSGFKAAGVNNYGVRLHNGAELRNTAGPPSVDMGTRGVTVITDQAAYVQGDFNCVRQGTGCRADRKIGASVIADSLNVLSRNWRDINSSNTNNAARQALDTRINAAFLAGVDQTDPATGYNGGLENYPRFHERWTGETLRYRGSFVSLGEPRHVDGPWDAQRYNPPIRDWNYDTDFNNPDNLPPLSPRMVALRQNLFSQQFTPLPSN